MPPSFIAFEVAPGSAMPRPSAAWASFGLRHAIEAEGLYADTGALIDLNAQTRSSG